jgi:hypothetical protein
MKHLNANMHVKLVATLWFCLTGCLVGMPIEEALVLDNLSPQVSLDQVSPPIDQIIEFRAGLDESVEFQTGIVVEPNSGDRLYWRWFLNYRAATFNAPIELSSGLGTFPEDLASEGISRTIKPCREPLYSLVGSNTLHRIELIITDRPFKGPAPDDTRPNQMIGENGTSAKLIWYFRFDRTECP